MVGRWRSAQLRIHRLACSSNFNRKETSLHVQRVLSPGSPPSRGADVEDEANAGEGGQVDEEKEKLLEDFPIRRLLQLSTFWLTLHWIIPPPRGSKCSKLECQKNSFLPKIFQLRMKVFSLQPASFCDR